MKAFLQYIFWSTIVSCAVLGFTMYKNETQRRLIFAVAKYAKSKYEGHADPSDVIKVLSEMQGSLFSSADPTGAPPDAMSEVTEVTDTPTVNPSAEVKRALSSTSAVTGDDGRTHYVQIDGKYYKETYNHVYVINGKRVFFEDQLHRNGNGVVHQALDDADAKLRDEDARLKQRQAAAPAPTSVPATTPTAVPTAIPTMSEQEMLKTLERAKANQDAERAYLNQIMTDK